MTSESRNAVPRLASVNKCQSGRRIGADSRITTHTATPISGKVPATSAQAHVHDHVGADRGDENRHHDPDTDPINVRAML